MYVIQITTTHWRRGTETSLARGIMRSLKRRHCTRTRDEIFCTSATGLHHSTTLAPTIRRIGLPSRRMVGAGLAPALFSQHIRLCIAFASRVLKGSEGCCLGDGVRSSLFCVCTFFWAHSCQTVIKRRR